MPTPTTPRIALLGDDRGHPSHRELNALLPRLAAELGADAYWLPTSAIADQEFDGLWLVPGSPYDDDAAVYAALTSARREGIPFLGTCAGMQYAVVSYLRDVVGRAASHAEADGVRGDNVVAPLACSLVGEERLVTPTVGSRFAELVTEPFRGMHFCSYAPTAEAVEELVRSGVVVGATAPDAGAEVLEFPGPVFAVASLFQPHIGASSGAPIHPLIRAFVAAAAERARATSVA